MLGEDGFFRILRNSDEVWLLLQCTWTHDQSVHTIAPSVQHRVHCGCLHARGVVVCLGLWLIQYLNTNQFKQRSLLVLALHGCCACSLCSDMMSNSIEATTAACMQTSCCFSRLRPAVDSLTPDSTVLPPMGLEWRRVARIHIELSINADQ